MDWDDVRTFLAISRAGTLSGAARTLKVTQSTMSRRLEALEARSGARLLQRTPHGYQLTAAGAAVLAAAERMEAEAQSIARSISGRDERLEGTVRITTIETLAARVLTGAVARLRERHPGIVIELVPDPRTLSLSNREADIAIRLGRFEGNELVARKLGGFSGAAYASRDYIAQRGMPHPGPGGLDGHVQVALTSDQAQMAEARWQAEMFREAPVVMRSNSRETLVWATVRGLGICALAHYRAAEEPNLVLLERFGLPPARDIWLGVHNDMRDVPRIHATIDAIVEEMQAWRDRLVPPLPGQ